MPFSVPSDNRPVPKPHFAAVSIQPAAGKPAPPVVQAISTAGSGPGRVGRPSLVPVPRSHRLSSFGSAGNGYQHFSLPQARKDALLNEKILESESDRSGNLGFGMTEKEIDERVRAFFYFITSSRFSE